MSSLVDNENTSYFDAQWRLPHLNQLANSFLGPFICFMVLQVLSQYTSLTWENGSFGAAVVILFSLTKSPANVPRHIFLGPIIAFFCAWASTYVFQSKSLLFLRVSFAVATTSVIMKLCGISYPPGGATAYILSTYDILNWSIGKMFMYLLFPLLVGTGVIFIVAYTLNHLILREPYPKLWI